jgi:hypothetical protein
MNSSLRQREPLSQVTIGPKNPGRSFARDFMQRTLAIAKRYDGPLDATLLVNCLLGLLIVPREALFEKIPATEFDSISEWGISPDPIKSFGRCEFGHEHRPNLRQIVRRLRNAVAHFKIDPIHESGKVSGYSFRDKNGFRAEFSLVEMKALVIKLANHLAQQA